MGLVPPRFPALAIRPRATIDRKPETIKYLDRTFEAGETIDQPSAPAHLGTLYTHLAKSCGIRRTIRPQPASTFPSDRSRRPIELPAPANQGTL